uniref:HTH luxR-type domain-containing protein n=1 Tax=Magnetococcus massalia (strain MO-1) TaxID=451514 RepID=A0A1S7LGH8_MAGMO|nr:Protein of unknown function. Containing DNA-binding HTH domain [Candidatus Magnetococcus massalia]
MDANAPPVELLDLLYEAVSDDSQWPLFMQRVAEHFDSSASFFICGDMAEEAMSFSAQHGIDPALLDSYAKQIQSDPRTALFTQFAGRSFNLAALMEHDPELVERWYASAIYQELFRSCDIEHLMAFLLPDGGARGGALGVFRPPTAKEYSEVELQQFAALAPHLSRAVKQQRQFAQLEEERWAALSILDDLTMGVIICEESTRVLFSNRKAQQIAKKRDGLSLRHGEVWANQQKESDLLRALTQGCVRLAQEGRGMQGQCLSLPRKQSLRPLHLRIMPIWKSRGHLSVPDLKRPVCAIYVTDPDLPQETEIELLQRMFGLTPKEAELLSLLVAGLSVQDSAKRMGSRVETARTHLKSIFAKTVTKGQSELVKLVATSPAWLNHTSSDDRSLTA